MKEMPAIVEDIQPFVVRWYVKNDSVGTVNGRIPVVRLVVILNEEKVAYSQLKPFYKYVEIFLKQNNFQARSGAYGWIGLDENDEKEVLGILITIETTAQHLEAAFAKAIEERS